ncbi:TPA: hypothetical protein N0F65_004717 [Lagenidium giganteum]|uniref:Kelch repeat-containing protein n=1 Tax=Lagenidium giganteum TaxID=4803 RepID=A0AAV2Z4Z9_9STRA|nr:TPA: hypothetical protein N0F65_004717 [Lagenidium giganteum]
MSAAVDVPSVRSSHAMTLLRPTKSALLFGGSDGNVFFDDFYLLEPADYASTAQARRDTSEQSADPDNRSGKATQNGAEPRPPPLALQWKKLLVSYAPAYPGSCFAATRGLPSSLDSDGGLTELPHVGSGRDGHSMHYVAEDDEERRGLRVLVVGNVIVSSEADKHNHGDAFEMEDLRIEEVRIRQPVLEAQWASCPVKSMWKPRARTAHSSVLVQDQLYCFGGKNADATKFFQDIFYYDVRLNQWKKPQTTGPHPPPRAFADMTSSGDKLFLYGGYDGKQQFGGLYMFDTRLNRWDKIVASGDKPATRINHTISFVAPNHIIMFGGRKKMTRRNDLYMFDLRTKVWAAIEAQEPEDGADGHSDCAPVGRTAHTALSYTRSSDNDKAERIIIFGGYAGAHRWLNDLHVLTLRPESHRIDSRASKAAEPEWEPPLSSVQDTEVTVACPALTQFRPTNAVNQGSGDAGHGHVLSDITNTTASDAAAGAAVLVSTGPTSTFSNTTTTMSRNRPPRRAFQGPRDLSAGGGLGHGFSTIESPERTKRRRREGSTQDSCSQSQDSIRTSSLPDTSLSQLLQQQQKVEEGITKLTNIIESEVIGRHRNDQNEQSQWKRDNERLSEQVLSLSQRLESSERQLKASESEKHELRERLAVAETELHTQRGCLNDAIPALTTRILEAIDASRQQQLSSSVMLECKVSAVHDLLEEMRHMHEDKTEADFSPEKKATQGHRPMETLYNRFELNSKKVSEKSNDYKTKSKR